MSNYNLPNDSFSLKNLNSIGSGYAQDFNRDISLLIQKETNNEIFDASPKQFYDLKLMNMKSFLPCNSDEFFFKEMGYQRKPIVTTAPAAAVSYPTTQTISITTIDDVATDMLISYQNGQKGTIISVNASTNEIVVAPLTNGTLPAVLPGENITYLASIEGDGGDGWSSYFRASTIERSNYVQSFSKAIRYGEVELWKLKKSGNTSNFITMEKEAMYRQFRIDCSNSFWMGEKAEGQLKDGTPAKLTRGVYTSMVEAGAPNVTATIANLGDAIEDVVLDSEFGEYGEVRFAFMAPRIHRMVSKYYKDELTRYQPQDMKANLMLNEMTLGSSRIVFIPFKRFEDEAAFPVSFKNKIVILDMKNINLRQMWGERSGETLSRKDGIPKKYSEMWVDANFGVEMYNPLACAWVDVVI